MVLVLALRTLRLRPVRSAVLAGGFGLGVAVMAVLLGVAEVILEQARAPELSGGGDVIVDGAAGRLSNAKFVLGSVLREGPMAPRVAVAAPTERANLYLIDGLSATPLRARGGIPSLERALGDPETSQASAWTDTPADVAWAMPATEDVLLAMDRFHPIPDVPERAASWAEWLYFNGRSGDAGFYLTFLAGPRLPSGRRVLGVRLQLDRGGRITSYSESAEFSEADLLARAPNLTVGRSQVRLVGREYHLTIDLAAESGGPRATGSLVLQALPGRSMPPLTIRGAAGWISGYVVPVMAGTLGGIIELGADRVGFDGGVGYHDHNWGFWNDVSWQWGQVHSGGGLSFVYGRIRPPADAADESRIPAFLVALGSEGPIGYATDVTIHETNEADSDRPRRIVVEARGDSIDLTMNLDVVQTEVTRSLGGPFGGSLDFLQMRARYHVAGRAGDTSVDFTAAGSAETFRGH